MGGHHGNKAAVRKAFRIKLLSVLQPRSSQNPHPEPATKMGPAWTKAAEAPFPGQRQATGPRKRGSRRRPGISSQIETQGFQSEIRQAVRTCYFFCGGAQKSSVIIANDVLWRPQSLRSRLPFKRNRNQSLHFFLFLFLPLFIFSAYSSNFSLPIIP